MIVGLGKTGISCARYFAQHGIPFAAMDSNPAPAALAQLRSIAPDARLFSTDPAALLAADEIVLSPGVPRANPEIQRALEAGIPVTGDVAMFAELADAPLVAITGSNGKSTVTALVGEMARHSDVNAGIGGNIGVPCLDLLSHDFELYVIEVSSYQLETADNLRSKVAVVLNLSPDHMDRYPNLQSYYATKARVYRGAECAIVNRDIDFEFDLSGVARVLRFSAAEPATEQDFGITGTRENATLVHGGEHLIPVREIRLRGAHNYQNALAALATGHALGWKMPPMLEALREFPGLAHRCQWVATIDGIDYINDSKATNTGATLAAVNGLASGERNIILILGGIGKGADFSVLSGAIARHVKDVYIYGRDRDIIAGQLEGSSPDRVSETLEQTLAAIRMNAVAGDLVLLSPGCASQDQYANFEARGDAFRALVMQEDRS